MTKDSERIIPWSGRQAEETESTILRKTQVDALSVLKVITAIRLQGVGLKVGL